MDIETLREKFWPDRTAVLLVGESPPASGAFFYDKSNMTTFTQRAFEEAYGKRFESTEAFLAGFKAKGCFLDDLSHDPVDHLEKKEREGVLTESIDGLARRLTTADPDVVVIVLKKIAPFVRAAAAKASSRALIYELPFPGNGHQGKYMAGLTAILRRHIQAIEDDT